MSRKQGARRSKLLCTKMLRLCKANQLFGRYSEVEMLALLGVATNLCQPQFSIEKTHLLRNEIIRPEKLGLFSMKLKFLLRIYYKKCTNVVASFFPPKPLFPLIMNLGTCAITENVFRLPIIGQ